ncbi:MAG: phosphotransferase [Steroidobacteraceae bacterium]
MAFGSIRSIDQIRPEWLTALLTETFPGTAVESVHIGTVINGTATKARLLLTYNRAGHAHRLPPTLWLKAGFEPHSGAEHLQAIYIGETLFYRDIAKRLDLGPPRCFAARFDAATGQNYLLLEDLLALHAEFGHAARPLTPTQAANVLEVQAKLHARFWRSHELDDVTWLHGGGALGKSGVHEMTFTPPIWDRCAALPRGRFLQGPLADRERMAEMMRSVLRHEAEHSMCLVHGDAQLMNLYFVADGMPGYLDWQTAMWSYWAHDVADFVVTCMTVDDRRRSERDLIDHYVRALHRHGITELTSAAAWHAYTRHTAYTIHWAVCLPEWQPEAVCAINTERACAAILDHRSDAEWC